MRLTLPLLSLLSTSAATILPEPQHVFSNPSSPPHASLHTSYRIPTVHESAVQARRILHLTNLGTLSTIFPSTHGQERRPSDVDGAPIGLMDYYADCEPPTGNPTILAITIATSFKNVDAGSNITLSLRWHPPDAHKRFYSAASLPRFSLVGYLEPISESEISTLKIAACFVKSHPDAAVWLPGNPIHQSKWVRLVVKEVYWIGGFGDRAYIGWIPAETWKNVTEEEIKEIRLPGEKKEGWAGLKKYLGC